MQHTNPNTTAIALVEMRAARNAPRTARERD